MNGHPGVVEVLLEKCGGADLAKIQGKVGTRVCVCVFLSMSLSLSLSFFGVESGRGGRVSGLLRVISWREKEQGRGIPMVICAHSLSVYLSHSLVGGESRGCIA
jgi:hypothetical protein